RRQGCFRHRCRARGCARIACVARCSDRRCGRLPRAREAAAFCATMGAVLRRNPAGRRLGEEVRANIVLVSWKFCTYTILKIIRTGGAMNQKLTLSVDSVAVDRGKGFAARN